MKKTSQAEALTTGECTKGIYRPYRDGVLHFRKDMKAFQSIPKRGEKDFEPDGTTKQQNLLQEGREAMYAALSCKAGLYHPIPCPRMGPILPYGDLCL